MTKDQDYVYVTYIKASPEKIWEALTSPAFTRRYWFNIDVTSSWKVGAPVSYIQDGQMKVDGKVLESNPYKILSYTFHESHGEASDEPATKVTIELEPEAGTKTVRLTVVHSDFVANSKHRQSISQGWPAVLSSLKTLLETGEKLEFEM